MDDKQKSKNRLPLAQNELGRPSKLTDEQRKLRHVSAPPIKISDAQGNDLRPDWMKAKPERDVKPSKEFGERVSEPMRIVRPDEK